MRSCPGKLRIAGLLLALIPVAPTVAATLDWPGPPPCNSTLMSCADFAQAGDTLRIVSSATVGERLQIFKPLSIVTAPGVSLTLTSTESHLMSINSAVPWMVEISGIQIVGGSWFFAVNGAQPGELTLQQLSFRGHATGASTQLQVSMNQTGSARSQVRIRRSQFEIGSDNAAPNSLIVYGSGSSGGQILIEDNRFRPEGVVMAQSAHKALHGVLGGSGVWEAVIRRNQMLPAVATPSRRYASGVEVASVDSASVNLLLHDNLMLLDQIAGAGRYGILLGGSGGQMSARVLNNTIVNAYTVLGFYANSSGQFDNNIVSGGFRFYEGAAPAGNFLQRGNLIFGMSETSSWPIAPGTLIVDPMLSAQGSPLPGSPVIDAGSDLARGASGPGTLGVPEAFDALHLRRLEGAQVDIGAFEGERLFYDGAE
ncbi:MAG: choice-of-anchor Q domain-containing protein [Lysobacterales bacterium]